MPPTTAMFRSINYLIDIFTAHPDLGAATPSVVINDGPVANQEYAQSTLWVGLSDPSSTGGVLQVGGTSNQTWAALGARARTEIFDVYCCAQGWDGGGDLRTARNVTETIIETVEAVIRDDISLGGNIMFVLPGVTGHVLRQATTARGVYAPCGFRITCKARLTD